MLLTDMIDFAMEDSERWFPQTAHNPFFVAACMAGEIGEVLNHLKKVERGTHDWTPELKAQVAEEAADVFTYLLHFCGTLGIDLEAEYNKKRRANEIRFNARRNLTEANIGSPTQIIPRIPAGEDRFA